MRPPPRGAAGPCRPRGVDVAAPEMLGGCVERALDRCHVAPMRHETLYDDPHLYDLIVPRGPCEPFYRSVARSTGGPVLEFACGTGRLTIPLAADGHDVVGLDSSACMLRRARAKAAEAGVPVSLMHGDMRHFALGQRFALVIVLQLPRSPHRQRRPAV